MEIQKTDLMLMVTDMDLAAAFRTAVDTEGNTISLAEPAGPDR